MKPEISLKDLFLHFLCLQQYIILDIDGTEVRGTVEALKCLLDNDFLRAAVKIMETADGDGLIVYATMLVGEG